MANTSNPSSEYWALRKVIQCSPGNAEVFNHDHVEFYSVG